MKRYSAERKESVIQKIMQPQSIPIPRLAEETGISDVTLYNWRKQARTKGIAVPADGKNPEKWSSKDKLAVVLGAELAEYCRHKGLYAEQIEACLQSNADSAAQAEVQRELTKKDRRQIKRLKRSCTVRKRPWPRRPRCRCSKKNPGDMGEGTARTNDQPR